MKPTFRNPQTVKASEFIGKLVKVVMDRPLGSHHPRHGFLYPVNYGYIPNTISGDGQELDAYVLGPQQPIEEFHGRCIAVITRVDDNDDKLVIVADGENFSDQEIVQQTRFQEQYFKSRIVR